jgi:hypothetical protein
VLTYLLDNNPVVIITFVIQSVNFILTHTQISIQTYQLDEKRADALGSKQMAFKIPAKYPLIRGKHGGLQFHWSLACIDESSHSS